MVIKNLIKKGLYGGKRLFKPLGTPIVTVAFVIICIFLFDFCLHCPFAIAKAIDGNDCKSKGQTKIKGQIRKKMVMIVGWYH